MGAEAGCERGDGEVVVACGEAAGGVMLDGEGACGESIGEPPGGEEIGCKAAGRKEAGREVVGAEPADGNAAIEKVAGGREIFGEVGGRSVGEKTVRGWCRVKSGSTSFNTPNASLSRKCFSRYLNPPRVKSCPVNAG